MTSIAEQATRAAEKWRENGHDAARRTNFQHRPNAAALSHLLDISEACRKAWADGFNEEWDRLKRN